VLWTVSIIAAVAVTLRILVNLLLPSVLSKVAASYDLTCDYQRSELNLLSGDAGLWDLKFTPKTGGEPVMSFGYVRGNISVRNLLRGRLYVWRMEADGAQIKLERESNGHFPLLEKVLADATATPTTAPPPASAPPAPADIDLTPPIKIDALRLTHVQTRLIDHTVSPAFDSIITMNVRVSDVRSPDKPATFEIDLWNDPALDLLRIEGVANAEGKNLDADVKVIMRGFQPLNLAHYLAPFGLRPVTRALAAQGVGKLKVTPAATPGTVAANLVLQDAFIWSEGNEVATLKRLEIRADQIDFTAAKIGQVLVQDVSVNAGASATGALQFAGFELAPVPRASAAAPSAQKAPLASPQPPSTQPWSMPYRVDVAQASLKNVRATFVDATVKPAAQLAFEVDELSAKNIVVDPNNPNAVVELSGTMRAPGLSQSITLGGQVKPFAATKTAKLTLSAQQINPEALRPYLDAAGFESELRSGSFTAEFDGQVNVQPDGRLTADAQITKLRFSDNAELLAMNDVRVRGAGVDQQTGAIRIDSVDISGPQLRARREASGQVALLGLRTKPAKAPATRQIAAAAPTTAPAGQAGPIGLPKLQIGRLTWKDLKLAFEDHSVTPATTVALADAGIEISDLLIGATSSKTGKLHAWLSAPGVIEKLNLEGTLTPQPNGVATDLRATGSGITGTLIKPYLAWAGIEPQLTDGNFDLHANVKLSQLDNGVGAAVTLDQVKYLDGQTELAGVDSLHIEDARLTPNLLSIGTVTIDKPRASASRDADGLLAAGGIKMLPQATTRPAPAPPAPAPTAAPATQPTPFELPFDIALKQLRVNDASIAWLDQKITPQVSTTSKITAQLDNLTIGKQSTPAPFTLKFSSEGAARQIDVTGTLTTALDAQGIDMTVNGQGLNGELATAYLPEGLQVTMRDGRLAANVSAHISKNPQGGQSARLEVKGVSLSEGDQAQPLLKLDSMTAVAPRVDLAGGVIAVDEVAVKGLETDVHLAADGSTRAVGIALVPIAAPATQPTTAPAQPAPGPSTEGQDVATIVAAARKSPPLITLERLDVNVARLSLHNDATPEAAAITLAGVQIANVGKLEVGGPDPQSRPPAQIKVTGKLDPLVDAFDVQTKLTPFAQQPSVVIDLTASGVKGEGLTKLAPQIKSLIEGGQLTDGRFRTHVEASGKFVRHGPYEIDFAQPFDMELTVNGTEFKGSADGPVLAGLENLRAEAIHVDPEKGGVHIKTLELTKPIGNAWRDKDGLHVLGWVIKVPGLTESPTTAPASESTAVLASASTPPAPTTQPASPPPAEIRVDRLLISGLDFRIEDRAVEPVMVIPLNGLDVDVRGLTNMALYENRQIRFSALLTSGPSPLPSVKKDASNTDIEDRELFSQISTSGLISLYPELNGWAKTSINGFELVSLRGLAHSKEITLGKGIFDGTIDTRFSGDGSMEARTRLVVTDLQIAEPPGGYLQKVLALPGTLDAVIGALQDPDDSITVPLTVPVKQGELSMGGVVGSAAGAFVQICVTAIASMPAKAVQGLLGTEKDAVQPQVQTLEFDPGVTGLDAPQKQVLNQLIARLRKEETTELTLQSELGGSDVERADRLANPSEQECRSLAERLGNRKVDLLSQRSQLAGEARGVIASSTAADASQIVTRLRRLDQQIAQTEDALDKVYELLRPKALENDSQRQRRKKAASLEMAQQRLDQTKAYLLAANIPKAGDRIHTRNTRFEASPESGGGKVVITVIAKKKQ
jgi:hypothetical protein